MYRFLLILLIFSFVLNSCSASMEEVTDNEEQEKPEEQTEEASLYPSWFENETEIVRDSTAVRAYASAVDSDSTVAVDKAEKQARENFISSFSETMEEIRNEAINEGGESVLSESGFVMALRNAEGALSGIPEIEEAEGEAQEDYKGYRGYVELAVSKDNLTETLETELSSHAEAWESLKSSEAYSDF